MDLKRQWTLDGLLVEWLLRAQRPFSYVDDPGFAEFMQGFNKSYKVPTRQRVAQMAIQRYASQREVLAHALKELEVRPAAILDLWRDLRGRHKLGLSLSFITDEWMQCDVCLAIEDFPEQHTSENIKNVVARVLDEFQVIPLCYVADNASNAVLASNMPSGELRNELRNELSDELRDELCAEFPEIHDPDLGALQALQMAFTLPTDSIGCHCHALELSIKAGPKPVEHHIASLRSFISSYRKSSSMQKFIASFTTNNVAPYLPKDVSTRWSSTFHLLQKFLSYKDVFIAAIEDYNRRPAQHNGQAEKADEVIGMEALDGLLDRRVLNILDLLRQALSPIAEAVNYLEGDRYPTLSLVQLLGAALLKHIRSLLVEESAKLYPSTTIITVFNTLQEDILSRFQYGQDLPFADGYMPIDYIAPALDPRTKHLPFMKNEEQKEYVWSHIQTLMKKDDTAEVVADATVVPTRQELSWLSAFSDDDNTSDDVSQELRLYRLMAIEPFGSDVLNWWKDRVRTLPRLARVARQYLGIPASSATVERIFSRAGSAMTKKRIGSATMVRSRNNIWSQLCL